MSLWHLLVVLLVYGRQACGRGLVVTDQLGSSRQLQQTSDPCIWVPEQSACRASLSAMFPSQSLVIALATHRARTTVCLTYMKPGVGSCDIGAHLHIWEQKLRCLRHIRS